MNSSHLTKNHPLLGTILDRYQLIKVLGMGTSATTYLAKDLNSIDSKFYVIKKIQYLDSIAKIPALAEKIFEIQESIADRVGHHPQIPTLVAKLEVDGDRYLVCEYIEGEPLSQLLTPGSIWSQMQVCNFLIDLMEILDFVHDCNYIHQAINPDNIIRADNGRFYAIGFSNVKDMGSTWQISDRDPRTLNDPSYTPYEQEQNVPKLNSDIYAVGAIAIQALTGRFPIERDAYSYELKWRDEVDIDLKLVDIINKMVRPDYRNRYQSAAEILPALRSFGLTQQLPTRKYEGWKPYLLVGAAACTLVVGFSALRSFSTSASKPQVMASTTTPTTTDNSLNWQSYVDKTARISAKYPPNWQQSDIHNIVTGERVMFTSPAHNSGDSYRDSFSIGVESLTNSQTSLASYTQSTIAEVSKYYQDAKIIESSSITLAKRPGNLIVYTGKDENSLLVKIFAVWTIDRGKAYVLTYKARPDRSDRFIETAMTIINSFEINSD
jgi:eukaryotic-like serine/threonine-protein kinase